jgi:hypothetical protein
MTFLCSVSLAASCHHLIARAEVVKRQILYHRLALVVSWMAQTLCGPANFQRAVFSGPARLRATKIRKIFDEQYSDN